MEPGSRAMLGTGFTAHSLAQGRIAIARRCHLTALDEFKTLLRMHLSKEAQSFGDSPYVPSTLTDHLPW